MEKRRRELGKMAPRKETNGGSGDEGTSLMVYGNAVIYEGVLYIRGRRP